MKLESVLAQLHQDDLPAQICQLHATVAELKKDAQEGKIRNDAIIDGLVGKRQEAQGKDRQFQGPSQSHLPSHEEMEGHRHRIPTASGPLSFPVTLGGTQGPPALSPYTSRQALPGAIDSPQIPQLTPQRTTNTTSQGPLDPEEAMESDSQAGSGSER